MTSIYEPTESVIKISQMKDIELIVIGDKKTPKDWSYSKVDFYDVKKQEDLKLKLVSNVPYNHYSRKNIGYLIAMSRGATIIIDIDDDNIPYNLDFPSSIGLYDKTDKDLGFVNIYNLYTDIKIWPRGLPLSLISKDFSNLDLKKLKSKVGVWQGLADLDPDVDALYRLILNEPCKFNVRAPVVLDSGTMSPFNSQNTSIVKDLFLLLYLPLTVSFRFTDILRSYVAQPIMWLYGWQLGFRDANVFQIRNEHNLLSDFKQEIPMYEREGIVDIVSNAISKNSNIYDNLLAAYRELLQHGIVKKEEIEAVQNWIDDVKSILDN